MSSGYFQLVFSSGEDDGSTTLSDEEETDVHVHYERPPTRPSISSNTSSTTQRGESSKTRSMAPMTYKAFIFLYCLLIMITGCACRAYLHGILRLIQRTVFVTDAEIRVMAIAYDIGLIFALVPLCCSNSTLHRPKFIGGGAALIGVGFLLACIPYFIMRTHLPRTDPEKNEYELCISPPQGDPYDAAIFGDKMAAMNHSTPATGTTAMPEIEKQPWSTIWIIMAMLVAGIGSAPQFALGIPFIEDTIRRPPMVFCIALVLSSQFGGIWVGQLASFFMWHHIGVANPETLTRWWLGFFVAAMGAFISGLVIFMYRDPSKKQPEAPKEKRSGSYQNGDGGGGGGYEDHSSESPYYQRFGHDSRVEYSTSLLGRVRRLSRNVPFISMNFGGALEAAMMTGLLVFLPRYLGSVTSTGIAPAQLFTGSAIIFGLVIGVFIGACLIYFRKWSPKKLSRMALLASVPALCLAWTLFFFHCDDPRITIGVKTTDAVIKESRNLHDLLVNANVTAPCDLSCPPCSSETITPVCGSDHLTYLSPCFAGCSNVVEIDQTDYDGHKSLNFTDCSCINMTRSSPASDSSHYQPGYAISGVCAVHCSPASMYWIILFGIYLLAGIQYTPHMMLMIRCVVPKDRTAALSILAITWHLAGYIPALIYFSFALNTSCILWSDANKQRYHECQVYDSGAHHLYFCTLVVFLKSFSVVSAAVTYRFTKDVQERMHRDWVNYDVLEMNSHNRREGDVTNSPAYI